MSLKSISPFIASVLLISFTIASGIIVYYFVTTLPKYQTSQVSSLSQQVISCAGGFFDVNTLPVGIYRKAITIDNTANPNNLTDYQVLVTNPIYNETGLVLSLHFNEGSGTIVSDSSGNGNTGTLVNGPAWVDGKFGKALSFDGVDDYVISSRGISPPSTFTANIWIYYTGDNGVVVDWLGQAAINTGYRASGIEIVGGTVRVRYWNLPCVNLGSITANNWYMITLVYDGSNLKGYINGEFKASTSGTLSHPSTLYIALGSTDSTNCGDGTYFAGKVDEFRFYTRALSEEEIKALYQAKSRLDYGDIRFTDSDGSTLLNYWQEADGRFWVKVPNIPANSTKTIYVYYGNPSATSLSNGDATFDFFDDFLGTNLDTNKWNGLIGPSGSLNVNNSLLMLNWSEVVSKNYQIRDGIIEYRGYSASQEISAIARANTNSNFEVLGQPGTQGLHGFYEDSTIPSWTHAITVADEIKASVASPITINKWYRYRAVLNGTNIQFMRFDDNWNLEATVSYNDVGGLTQGYIGLRVDGLGERAAYYDWIRVRKYTSPEPTTSVRNEENITISLLSSGSPSASMGNQFTSMIYLTNGTIIQRDFSLDNNCNLGKDCPLGKSTISLNSDVAIDKIRVCSKACSLICNEIKVS
jgi:hypothetical protein